MGNDKQSNNPSQRCIKCGFFGKRSKWDPTLVYEAFDTNREKGAVFQHDRPDGGRYVPTTPCCYLNKLDLRGLVEEQQDWAKQNLPPSEAINDEWHQESIALRIATDNGCESWVEWQPYWSPAVHFEDRRMRQLEDASAKLQNRFTMAGLGLGIFAGMLAVVQVLTMTKDSLLWKGLSKLF